MPIRSALAPILALALGCAAGGYVAPVRPPLGVVYGHQSVPLQTDFEATRVGARHGTSSTQFLRDPFLTGLPIATWGDGSVERAARDGGIQTLQHADLEVLNVLGIYMRLTVHAYGD